MSGGQTMFIVALASLGLILFVLVEAFEAIVLPRRVTRPYRFTRFYYRYGWALWRLLALRLRTGRTRQPCLSWFGPLSLLGLFPDWVVALIVGFGLLAWSLELPIHAPDGQAHLGMYLYASGVNFFTLGLGDVTPQDPLGRLLTVAEAGLGFSFLALVVSYLPVLYQAFSRREVT